MRGAIRRPAHEEEEESAFVSMTDLTVSFLFIVIILLAFFASQLKDEKTVPVSEHDALRQKYAAVEWDRDGLLEVNEKFRGEIRRLHEELARENRNQLQAYLSGVARERQDILTLLRDRLLASFPEMQGLVTVTTDALQLKGEGLFESSESRLKGDKRRIVEAIAVSLSDLLPCYTFGKVSGWRQDCNAAAAVIEAVQIEGHTDSSGQNRSNFDLSAARAIETLFAMTLSRPELVDYQNIARQPVISIAGYGPLRPVADNRIETGRATNRRIDLRIIMYTPQNVSEVENVKERLRRGMSGTALQ